MRWVLLCAECAQTLRVRKEQEGLSVRCPCCGASLVVVEPPQPVRPAREAKVETTSPDLPPIRKPFWRRRWVIGGLGMAALLILLLVAVGPTVAERLSGESEQESGDPRRMPYPMIPAKMAAEFMRKSDS